MGRRSLPNYAWTTVKWAVDEIRENNYCGSAVDILRDYGLWDEDRHYIDEERLNKFYMELS